MISDISLDCMMFHLCVKTGVYIHQQVKNIDTCCSTAINPLTATSKEIPAPEGYSQK